MPSSKLKTKPKPKPTHEWSFEAIGTQWQIGIYEPVKHIERLRDSVTARIQAFDADYSRFREDSLVTKMSRQAGEYNLPLDAQPLLAFYRELYDATDGKVTPLIGSLLDEAGYDASYSLKPQALSPVPSWDESIELDGATIRFKQTALLDFGAAGKGYLVDVVAQLFRAEGLEHFCIDASGDLYCAGLAEPLQIGLEHPNDADLAIGVAGLKDRALCASATNRRKWAEYHHIMDPTTLTSPQHIAAVWTIAQTTMLADGLTTALFFVPPEKLQRFSFEYVILYADGRAQYSPGWPGELFT